MPKPPEYAWSEKRLNVSHAAEEGTALELFVVLDIHGIVHSTDDIIGWCPVYDNHVVAARIHPDADIVRIQAVPITPSVSVLIPTNFEIQDKT